MCWDGDDPTHNHAVGTLTGGFPPGVHYWTLEGRDSVLDDIGSGTSALDSGSVNTDPFPCAGTLNIQARAAFSNSDGSVLLSPWSDWINIDSC